MHQSAQRLKAKCDEALSNFAFKLTRDATLWCASTT
jgi:hypothetical protein